MVSLFLDSKKIREILTSDERTLSYHARKMGVSSANLSFKLKSDSIMAACFFGDYLKMNPKDLLTVKKVTN